MWPIRIFRIVLLPVAAISGIYATLTLVSLALQPSPFSVPSRSSVKPTDTELAAASYASKLAPFRSDAKVQYALGVAAQVLKTDQVPGTEAANTPAERTVRDALAMVPYDSRLWLALANLQARQRNGTKPAVEALKMSYFTGLNREDLISVRLDRVTIDDSLSDADLRQLARADVRAILTRLPDQKHMLLAEYVRASRTGKAFLIEAADVVDPGYASLLRGLK